MANSPFKYQGYIVHVMQFACTGWSWQIYKPWGPIIDHGSASNTADDAVNTAKNRIDQLVGPNQNNCSGQEKDGSGLDQATPIQ